MPEANEVQKQLDELVELNKQLLAQNEEVKTLNATLAKENKQLQDDIDELLNKAEDGGECKMEDGSMGMMKDGKCVAKVDKTALPESVRKQLDEQQAQIKKQAEDIQKLRDEKEEKEYVAKAAAYSNLPIKAEELGPILKSASVMPEPQRKELERVLKAADAAFAELTKMKGNLGGGETGGAYEKLMGLAKELKKAEPKMTIEKAFTKVCEENPELYRQHRDEQRAH